MRTPNVDRLTQNIESDAGCGLHSTFGVRRATFGGRTFRRVAFTVLILGLLGTALVSGCGGKPRAAVAATQPVDPIEQARRDNSIAFRTPGQSTIFYLDVYQVSVPIGAVSQSEEFWRLVDEDRIDPARRDLLLKNGVRVGIGETGDWDYFRKLIEKSPHFARTGSAVATGTGTLEITMKQNVLTQDIFLLRGQGHLSGRTYDRCHNVLGVSFWPDPREETVMRVSVSPTVRSTRTFLEYNRKNEEKEPAFVDHTPEYLYDLNLDVRIPGDRFLVMGLSEDGRWPTSLGHQFLTLDGDIEKKEQVLVFVPRTRARQMPATTQAAPEIDAAARQ
ncbi:hypothetical protein [Humisphaera borealis]|uniref:Uncharacterized protein n=1 Tax=Humisphaera borealis TaxID=2807512 RepID=A0A7M2X114_9BACT|nr:hypothetical protein [Humisphaera borealis]QOV91122.1 hypothetical protein IPV69_07125 [Humisphaera borealis]